MLVPGCTTVTNLRRFAGRALRKVGKRQVIIVRDLADGMAPVQDLETNIADEAEMLYRDAPKKKSSDFQTRQQVEKKKSKERSLDEVSVS